jgi:alpha-beta hydrolase superfamily lysophospholipase
VNDLRSELRRHRWRLCALGLIIAAVTVGVLLVIRPGASSVRVVTQRAQASPTPVTQPATAAATTQAPAPTQAAAPPPPPHPSAVGVRALDFYDQARGRRLTTVVRYPATAPAGVSTVQDAAAAGGPYPLVVFGHGFAVSPTPYDPLLDRWVRAGFIVAAPIFPKSNANAPGGPNERDLPNQAGDMNFVIQSMLALSAAQSGSFAARITPDVAVAGQSDGGDTALAAAFDPTQHSEPVEAAVILSGAEDPFAAPFTPQPGTPLLATQGTADTVNRPEETMAFYRPAGSPKYLLLLDGASHQEPYTQPGPQLDAVSRITIAFLNRYLKLDGAPLRRLVAAHNAGPGTELQSSQ